MKKWWVILCLVCGWCYAGNVMIVRGPVTHGAVDSGDPGWTNPNTALGWFPFNTTNITNLGSIDMDGVRKPTNATGPTRVLEGTNAIVGVNFGREEHSQSADGSDDWIAFTNTAWAIDSSTSFTWMAWIKADTDDYNGTFKVICDENGLTSVAAGISVFFDDRGGGNPTDGIQWSLATGDGNQLVKLSNIFTATPTWVHVTLAYDSDYSDGQMWTNGVLATVTRSGTATGNFVPATGDPTAFFGVSGSGNFPSKCSLAHVKFYNFAMTTAQVSNEVFNVGGQGLPIFDNMNENGY